MVTNNYSKLLSLVQNCIYNDCLKMYFPLFLRNYYVVLILLINDTCCTKIMYIKDYRIE